MDTYTCDYCKRIEIGRPRIINDRDICKEDMKVCAMCDSELNCKFGKKIANAAKGK